MKNLKQNIIKFNHDKNFKYEDFYVSNSNKHILELFNNWPNWEKNFLNIIGENFSGKTHLMNIFLKEKHGIIMESNQLNNENLLKIKNFKNIILENVDLNINEKLLYTLINIIDQEGKYLIITSVKPLVRINFKLDDLKSRAKNFILQNIEKPDDDLIYAIILKNLSDRQILIDKKLINFIVKRIDRSYSKISDFIYKIDEISLKRKKPIDFKIIKEALED